MAEKTMHEEFQEAWARLTTTQKARVMLKQQWEACSRLAVFKDWRTLFDADREQDENELAACRELIAKRPELFRENHEGGVSDA